MIISIKFLISALRYESAQFCPILYLNWSKARVKKPHHLFPVYIVIMPGSVHVKMTTCQIKEWAGLRLETSGQRFSIYYCLSWMWMSGSCVSKVLRPSCSCSSYIANWLPVILFAATHLCWYELASSLTPNFLLYQSGMWSLAIHGSTTHNRV